MKTRSQGVVAAITLVVLLQGVIPHTVSYARARASQEVVAMSLPDGRAGQGYEYHLQSQGGLAPLSWKVVGGELPPGLSLEPSGTLKGLPSAPRREAYSFVIEVCDSSQPRQRAEQSCLLKIEAATLKVISSAKGFRVVSPAAPPARDSNLLLENRSAKVAFASTEKGPETTVDNQTPSFSWPVAAPKVKPSFEAGRIQAAERNPVSDTTLDTTGEELNPAYFVQIFEVPKARSGDFQAFSGRPVYGQNVEIYGKLIYSGHVSGLNNTRLTADETSTIAIRPNVSGRDIAFNTVYMAAELSSGDTKQNLEVMNYSEVGTAPTADAFVIGASFASAKDILDKLITLQRRATDALMYVLAIPTARELTDAELNRLIEIDQQPDNDPLRRRAREAFDLYLPEIESITSFLVTETNRNIVERVANNLFHIDRDTLIAIAKQFSADTALLQSKDADTQNVATRRLLSRTIQVYKDFRSARAEILAMSTSPPGDQPDNPTRERLVNSLRQLRVRIAALPQESQLAKGLEIEARKMARDIYAYDRSSEAITNLRQTKFPVGWVSLDEARAKDGDTLKLTVRVQNPAGAGTGNKVPFYIAVKRYGVKLHWASSFMFIKRTDIIPADLVPDANGNALTDVNFAPSPGVSYGFTYFKRGETGGSKVLRALAPTVGINVSFMNFKDPGFDLSTGMFTNTTGTDVQVGTGPIVSLFNNKLHFIPVGWNLNVDRKRRYWGIGFGFVEFAKELGKYLKSS